MQRQEHRMWHQDAVEPAGDRFASPIGALVELLTKWSMWIRFGEYITIAILVEGVFQWIAMRWQLYIGRNIGTGPTLLARGTRIRAGKFPFLSIVFGEGSWKHVDQSLVTNPIIDMYCGNIKTANA